MNLCVKCGKEKPVQEPGYVTFHICNNRSNWKDDPDIIQGEVVNEQRTLGTQRYIDSGEYEGEYGKD
jgi:hypothetical protein